MPLAEEAQALWARVGQEFAAGASLRGNYRLGVTELIALTWLTRLIQRLQDEHPDVTLEPVVDAGVRLFDRLQAQQIDLCIMPGTFWGADFTTVQGRPGGRDLGCQPPAAGTARAPTARVREPPRDRGIGGRIEEPASTKHGVRSMATASARS